MPVVKNKIRSINLIKLIKEAKKTTQKVSFYSIKGRREAPEDVSNFAKIPISELCLEIPESYFSKNSRQNTHGCREF